MIDITNEQLLTFNEAAQFFRSPRTGKPAHVATLYRWASRGAYGVRLGSVKIGGTRYTTIAELKRFAGAQSSEAPEVRAPRARSESRETRTTQILESHGLDR